MLQALKLVPTPKNLEGLGIILSLLGHDVEGYKAMYRVRLCGHS